MKRRLWCACALLLALTVQVYAGGGGEPAAAKPKELVKIQFWEEWAPDGAQGKVLQKLVDKFNAEFAGQVEVTLAYMGGKRNEKIAAALSAGTPPEIAWISGSGESYYEAEQLLNMSKVYDGKTIDKNDIFPALIENQQYLGKDISIPFENSMLALIYNKKMLQDAGIPFPSPVPGQYTWDQFIKDANKLTNVKEGKYGYYPRWATAMIDLQLWETGHDYFSADLKKNLLVSDPETQKAMIKVLNRLHRMLWIDPITTNDVGDQGFGSKDMAFEITGPWALPRYLEPEGQFKAGEIGVAAIPCDDDTKVAVSYWYQKALALFKVKPDQEWGMLQFIKWFYSAPIHAQWCAEAGYLPVTKSAMEHPTWKANEQNNPWVKVFLDQVSIMRRRPSGIPVGNTTKLQDTVRFQEGTPEEALKVYQQDAQALLDEFWSMH